MKKPESHLQPIEQSTLREYFLTIVVCTIFALFVTTYVVHPMTVPTPSMVPTILVGDRLLIDKFTIRNGFNTSLPLVPTRELRRGDVLVFKFPEDPEILYVKRLIGLPGDLVEIRDKNVFINHQVLKEPYKHHQDGMIYQNRSGSNGFFSNLPRDNFGPERIPQGHLFMMGDNRDNSQDSRYWGFLPITHVVGRPLFVFWSYQDDPSAHTTEGLWENAKLYGGRILNFVTKTRWLRTFHVIR